MDKDKFEKLVWEGIEAIPKRFLKKLNNVDVVIEDEPTKEQMRRQAFWAIPRRTSKQKGILFLGFTG